MKISLWITALLVITSTTSMAAAGEPNQQMQVLLKKHLPTLRSQATRLPNYQNPVSILTGKACSQVRRAEANRRQPVHFSNRFSPFNRMLDLEKFQKTRAQGRVLADEAWQNYTQLGDWLVKRGYLYSSPANNVEALKRDAVRLVDANFKPEAVPNYLKSYYTAALEAKKPKQPVEAKKTSQSNTNNRHVSHSLTIYDIREAYRVGNLKGAIWRKNTVWQPGGPLHY